MNNIRITKGVSPYDVWAEIQHVGEDIQIIIGGGERPHIGAVAFAEPSEKNHPVTGLPINDNKSDAKCKVTTVVGEGHKEKEVAATFAEAFCEKFKVNISVSAGIHTDDASTQEIELFLKNIALLLDASLSSCHLNSWKEK